MIHGEFIFDNYYFAVRKLIAEFIGTYLLALAVHHGGHLVTLDRSIAVSAGSAQMRCSTLLVDFCVQSNDGPSAACAPAASSRP